MWCHCYHNCCKLPLMENQSAIDSRRSIEYTSLIELFVKPVGPFPTSYPLLPISYFLSPTSYPLLPALRPLPCWTLNCTPLGFCDLAPGAAETHRPTRSSKHQCPPCCGRPPSSSSSSQATPLTGPLGEALTLKAPLNVLHGLWVPL